MTIRAWQGVYPAVTTKFRSDLRLDVAAMEKHFAWQIESGVDGLIVCGSLGENSVLAGDEKLEVLRIAVRVSARRVPVLQTIAEGSTAEGIALSERSAREGADGFMVLPGMRYVSDRRETIAHYRAIAQASAKPIMVYNNPVAYGVDVTPDMFGELADEKAIVAIKESSDDVRRVTDIINRTRDRYAIFCGVDDLAMEAMLMGARGWVAGLVNAFPRETVAIHRLIMGGKIEEARRIYRWFAPLLHLDVSRKLVQNIKLVESIVGVGTEAVRPPRLALVGQEREEIIAIVKQALATRPVLPA
ncbi:MAG: dihydrodipicolinate synthase family protein [Betaproteobacteria bacterium]|nr:MAG: dihydrodipicolinate synthase family protein [Betaproteobacteria bacterium]